MGRLLLESSANPSSQWAVIALGVLTILYIAVIRPMRKGRRKDPLERTPAQLSLAQQRVVEREMTNLLVEYEEMLRRMSAQLETRAAKLELLIREADEKLQKLEKLARSPVPDQEPAASQWQPGPPPGPPGLAGTEGAASWKAEPALSQESARDALVVGAAAGEAAPSGSDPRNARHAEVYDLADRGRTPPQIAQQLKRPSGEIELILALRSAQKS